MLRNNNKNTKTHILLGLMVAPAVVSGMILSASFVSANDSVVDTITAIVPSSCTMSGSGMTSHSANVSSGTYTSDIGTTTMNVVCNDTAGFSIYAAGFTGNNVGGANSNKLLGTIASGYTTIDTGTATGPGYEDKSNWAMKLETDSYATYPIAILDSYDFYHAVPNDYTKVATSLTGTDAGTGATGATLTSTYAIYTSKAQPADTYTGQVKYILLHPNTEPAPFLSTCTVPVPNVTYMQELATMTTNQKQTLLSNMTEDTQYFLKDSRDGKPYCVAKLQDGNLWMTQNLDHDIKNDGSVIYDNTTTDIGYNTTTDQYATASWQPDIATHATSDTRWNSNYYWRVPGSGYIEPDDDYRYHAESYDPGDLYWDGIADGTTTASGDSHYHLGNYYNWSAAVAMNNTETHKTRKELIDQSICPAGWSLPRGGTGDDTIYALWDEYGFASGSYKDTNGNDSYDVGEDAVWASPLFFTASGEYNGLVREVGFVGNFWSPVIYSGSDASYADFNVRNDMLPGSGPNRIYGYSVRCVARPVSNTISGV